MDKTIKIGTRGSKLALWQANWVKSSLEVKHPSLSIELETITTKGDKILDVPLAKVGGELWKIKDAHATVLIEVHVLGSAWGRVSASRPPL